MPTSDLHFRGARMLFIAACLVAVIAGLKAAASFFLPFLVALFLSILCIPPMQRLQRHRVPTAIAIFLVVSAATICVLIVFAIIGDSITAFNKEVPYYRERLAAIVEGGFQWLQSRGLDVDSKELAAKLDTGFIMELAGDIAAKLFATLSYLLLVVFMMIFMLIEANDLPSKLRTAIGNPEADLSDFSRAAEQIRKYIATKVMVSLATGALVIMLLWALDVDFPLLWGLLAFLFNFIPNIGSIIAAIPAVLLTLVQYGPGPAFVAAGGYLAINMIIGNGIEPRLMGRRLGLSPLVVFVSLFFWYWVWGPLGMLLSVPLTVIVKIVFEHSEDFRWLAVLLGPRGEEIPAATRASSEDPAPAGPPAEIREELGDP